MKILVNGEPLALDNTQTGSLGALLSELDEILEKAGALILGISVDGRRIDEDYPSFADKPLSEVELVEVEAESSRALRLLALRRLSALAEAALGAADTAAAANRAHAAQAELAALGDEAENLRDKLSGFFSADELSLLSGLAESLAAASPGSNAGASLKARAAQLVKTVAERAAELQNPIEEMRAAFALFAAQAEGLAEISVLLQTGGEAAAMKNLLAFIELFNKVLRIIPELKSAGLDSDDIKVEGQALADFYAALNEVLRELGSAFERKDAVTIGDLVEYEVLPRMKSLFAAIDQRLPR